MRSAGLILRLLAIYLLSASCQWISPKEKCFSESQTVSDAYELAVGRWQLTSIKSGWTGNITQPTEPAELIIDNDHMGVVMQQGKEVMRFNLVLTKVYESIQFTAADRTANLIYLLPPQGNFRSCTDELVFDDTYVDGPALIYQKIK
ncbi:hypothetical protein WBJ53_01825 [Spirosoma sp. SC4-14]|uniref:hypothetical protein n=1 Tax=Spirosoma sp. SC4-14 TaxID=3128900 RepID=UPI0030D22242